jgi:glutamate 5-kinase
LARDYRRIVVKIGSSLFIPSKKIHSIIRQVADLVRRKKEVIIVSSGAIACGMSILDFKARPEKLAYLQATAAVGQNELMRIYCRHFASYGIRCAQMLLTWEDFNSRRRYVNARNTILTSLRLGLLPVVNENDTVSIDEIRFGDNDRLSALVASLIEADILIILSDVDGLYDGDGELISLIEDIRPEIEKYASPSKKEISTGGMVSKLQAARIAIGSRIPCIIANGTKKGILDICLREPFSCGTLFLPKQDRLVARKRWLAFGARSRGKVFIDKGAKEALVRKKSLLSVGVVSVRGEFRAGDIVDVVDEMHKILGRGKVNFSSQVLEKIKGRRAEREVIHCDNLVIL